MSKTHTQLSFQLKEDESVYTCPTQREQDVYARSSKEIKDVGQRLELPIIAINSLPQRNSKDTPAKAVWELQNHSLSHS